MSLSEKQYYFLTNRSTLFRYFVDNSSGKPKKYLFYPQKYQTMTNKEIVKYERNLTMKLLWWSMFNKNKMLPRDHQICFSKTIDCGVILVASLLMVRISRVFLFRHEFIALESWMQSMNLDIKFWKALTATTFSLGIGYSIFKKMVKELDIADLAVEYSRNFSQQLTMPQIKFSLSKFYETRFPWLSTQTKS